MAFRPGYAAAALAVFAIEAAIAAFVHDGFVRPHLGDSLAVVLVYLGLRAVTRLGVTPATGWALGIAVGIEIGQYFHFARALGLGGNAIALVVLGSGFDPLDLLAYAAGALAVIAVERLR